MTKYLSLLLLHLLYSIGILLNVPGLKKYYFLSTTLKHQFPPDLLFIASWIAGVVSFKISVIEIVELSYRTH